MNFTHTIVDYTFQLSFEKQMIDNNELLHLKLYVINNVTLDDYECLVPEKICNEKHSVLTNLKVLFDVLVDGFNKKSNNINLNIKFNETDILIDLLIQYPYVVDSMSFTLKLVKDLKDLEKVDNKIKHLNTQYNHVVKKNTDDITDLYNIIEQLSNKIHALEQGTMDVVNYIIIPGCVSILTNVHKHAVINQNDIILDNNSIISNLFYKSESNTYMQRVHTLYTGNSHLTQRDITINMLYNEFIVDLYVHLFVKMKSLLDIKITKLDIVNLAYFVNNRNLTKLEINNCSKLTDISHILQFNSLETLCIANCLNIKNLYILEDHSSLKELQVQKNMNTNVFSKNVSFKITIID